MVIDFSQLDYKDSPLLILKTATEQVLGVLAYAKDRELKLNYPSVSTLSFGLPSTVDGAEVPFYDDVVGMRIIEVQNIGQFIINNPEEEGDGVHREKHVEAYSLEHEFVRKKITLGEGTYRFYDPNDNDNSLFSMIMELMPAWHIGTIADAIKNKYRTFSVENENLYDFMMNKVQETYGCIFEFNTLTKTVDVRDIESEPSQRAVWLSDKNLAKSLNIREDTDNVFTRLDVNGADGVDIRDVNPDGTNKIVNLDYYMTTDNFSQALIDKYNAWKTLYNSNKDSYYSLSIRYTLTLMQQVTEQAHLTDLKNDVMNLDNQRAVTIQAISQGLQTQSALDSINAQMQDAEAAVAAKEAEISVLETSLAGINADMTSIRNQCNFREYFTDEEWLLIDRYIVDGDVTEGTFVADTTGAYMDEGMGNAVTAETITFSDGEVAVVTEEMTGNIYGVINAPSPFVQNRLVQDLSELRDTDNAANVSAGFYFSIIQTTGTKYFANSMNNSDCYNAVNSISSASVWYFQPSGDNYLIYTYVNNEQKYMKHKGTGNLMELTTVAGNATEFELSWTEANKYNIKIVNEDKWVQFSKSGGGFRLYTDNNNAENSRIIFTYANSLTIPNDVYGLDDSSYGIAYYNDSATAAAMLAEESAQCIMGLGMTTRRGAGGDVLLISQENEIPLWTFESIQEDKYYITVTVDNVKKYLTVNGGAVTLESSPNATYSVITAAPGTGANAGKWHFTVNGYSLNLVSVSGGFNAVTGVGSTSWMSLSQETEAAGRSIYRLGSGVIQIGEDCEANLVSGTIEYYQDKFVGSMCLNSGVFGGSEIQNGCISFTGKLSQGAGISATENTDGENDGTFSATYDGYLYFTYDVSEYQRRSVAWDLMGYGEKTLRGLSEPSYTFGVESANFLSLDEFRAFRNELRLGQRIYLETKDDRVVYPILVSATLNLDDLKLLTLEFSDKYSISSPAQKLIELLGQTVSMSKTVEAGRYTYSSFKDSGAATGIKTRMMSALDVSKNNIINSSGQAASWDASGVHLRKWSNAAQTSYDDEQIWMTNNMIAMTDDGWDTAKMAVGKFRDSNLGDCWGIVAPMVMGTMIAGESLIIESQKKSGGTAVFRMDEDGCRLYNSDFLVSRTATVDGQNKTTTIALNPDFGIAIGDGQLYSVDAQTGAKTLDTTHANFWADDSGNLHLTGAITATSLYIGNETAENYVLSVSEDGFETFMGQNYAYLHSDAIEFSVTTQTQETNTITLDDSGISIQTVSGGNVGNTIHVGADGVEVKNANYAINVSPDNLYIGDNITSGEMTTFVNWVYSGSSEWTSQDPQPNAVLIYRSGIYMSAGKFSVYATSSDSVIKFGGNDDDPNFSLGLGGDIVAQSGSFGSITVKDKDVVMSPQGYTAPNVVVSTTRPNEPGSGQAIPLGNTVWIQPNANSRVDYTRQDDGTSFGENTSSATQSIEFVKEGSDTLAGSEVRCGIEFSIYNWKYHSSTSSVTVAIKPTSLLNDSSVSWVEIITNQSTGSLWEGSTVSVNTALSPKTISNVITSSGGTYTWTDFSSITVRITFQRSGTSARMTKTSLKLHFSNTSTATVQSCNVYYIT